MRHTFERSWNNPNVEFLHLCHHHHHPCWLLCPDKSQLVHAFLSAICHPWDVTCHFCCANYRCCSDISWNKSTPLLTQIVPNVLLNWRVENVRIDDEFSDFLQMKYDCIMQNKTLVKVTHNIQYTSCFVVIDLNLKKSMRYGFKLPNGFALQPMRKCIVSELLYTNFLL